MTESSRRWIPVLILAIAAFAAIFPLVLHGCSCGHDFDFHIVNWLEAHQQFAHGNLHPHWAFTAAWGAGEPRFVFYPPISWTIGGLLGFIMPYTVAPIIYTWLCLFLAGLTARRLAKSLGASSWIGTAIGILYLANPYILFTAYERTAYAELLAAAWMPLLLTAILRTRPRVLEIALTIALLWLTNAPAAVVGCYGLLIVGVFRLFFVNAERVRVACSLSRGTVTGIGLAAFYIVPAAYEKTWVQISMAILPGLHPRENFLFGHTSDPLHDTVLWQASRIAVCLLLLTFSLAAFLYKQQEARVLGASAFVIALLLLPVSLPIWNHAPQLAFLQFPWRFLALLQAIAAALLALVLHRHRTDSLRIVYAGVLTAALIASTMLATQNYRQGCDEEDAPAAHVALFKMDGGVEPTDEYTTKDADNDLLEHDNAAWWLVSDPNAPAPVIGPGNEGRVHIVDPARSLEDASWSSERTKIRAISQRPAWLVINRRAYPAWQVTSNSQSLPIMQRADGLIAVPLPRGLNSVELRYQKSADQYVGQLISLLTFFLSAFFYWRNKERDPNQLMA